MDSTIVNKAIRQAIKPLLKEKGFTQFTARSAWRYMVERIDVVNFQSFNFYLADVVGCTTYSFGVNLGVYFVKIPHIYGRLKEKNGVLFPQEYECLFRKHLKKSIVQQELPRDDIWYIDPKGDYLNIAIENAKKIIIENLLWLDRFDGPKSVMNELEEIKQSYAKQGLWGKGAAPAPHWRYHAGYVALWLKDYDLALKYFKPVDSLHLIEPVQHQIEDEIKKIERNLTLIRPPVVKRQRTPNQK